MMGDFVGHFFLLYWIDLMELYVSLKNHLIGRHHWSSLLSPSTLWTVCVWLNSQSKLVVLSLLFSFKWITFFFLKLQVLRLFFIQLSVAHSVIRGQVTAVKVVVFNNLKKRIDAEVTFEDTGDFHFLEDVVNTTLLNSTETSNYPYSTVKLEKGNSNPWLVGSCNQLTCCSDGNYRKSHGMRLLKPVLNEFIPQTAWICAPKQLASRLEVQPALHSLFNH